MKNKLIIYVLERMRDESINRRIELLQEMLGLIPSESDRGEIEKLIAAYQAAETAHDQLMLKL